MIGISGFFKNIKNAFTKEVITRTKIQTAIKKFTNVEVLIENINYKSGVVFLKKMNPTVLSVIYIKKPQILNELNNNQAIKVIDIK